MKINWGNFLDAFKDLNSKSTKSYFTKREVKGLKNKLVVKLNIARDFAQVPFILTETIRKQKSKIGAKNSAHYRGYAVDIRCSKSRNRFKIVKALLNAGFYRIGIYDKHIHADCDPSLPKEVIWLGKSK